MSQNAFDSQAPVPSTIVFNFWKKKFKREPDEAVLVETMPFGQGRIQKVMVRDGSKLTCVLVVFGKGKTERIFLEQD